MQRVLGSAALREGAADVVIVEGWQVVLVRSEGVVRAALNRCPHAGTSFVPGCRVRRGILMCPAHGAQFRLADGSCVGGLYGSLRMVDVGEKDGWIEVAVPSGTPSAEDLPVRR